jgi:hypothetical protein
MVCDAHLFILQFHTSSFGAGWKEEVALLFFSATQCREAFHGLGFHDITEFDSDCCSVFCLLGEKRKREKKGNGLGAFFSPGPNTP